MSKNKLRVFSKLIKGIKSLTLLFLRQFFFKNLINDICCVNNRFYNYAWFIYWIINLICSLKILSAKKKIEKKKERKTI